MPLGRVVCARDLNRGGGGRAGEALEAVLVVKVFGVGHQVVLVRQRPENLLSRGEGERLVGQGGGVGGSSVFREIAGRV